jgi:hypothetical protein
VFDQIGIAVVGEARGKPPQNAGPRFHLPQKQTTCIRRNCPTVESGGNRTLAQPLEIELPYATLCCHRVASLLLAQVVFNNTTYATEGRPFSIGV